MPSTLNEFLEKALEKNEDIKSAVFKKGTKNSTPLIKIADIFVRYLIGDKDIAVSQLKKEQVSSDIALSAKEYNDLYSKFTKELFAVIQKNMKDIM